MQKVLCTLIMFCSLFLSASMPASAAQGTASALPAPGRKIPLDSGHYFTYGFVKDPKIGTAIMRVDIFSKGGARDTTYTVKGDADMPSMRGAHSSGEKAFSLSQKGAYLLPVHLVMPGDWEVALNFLKNGRSVFRGSYRFDID